MNNNLAKKEKHINFLKKIGFLIAYNSLELYHGRRQETNEDWFVRSDIDNSFDKNRNNIMGIPCLCVASYAVAESYAKGSSFDDPSKMKIYEIVSTDENALIINEKFNINKLSENDVLKFYQAIQSLTSGALKSYLNTLNSSELVLAEIDKKSNEYELISEVGEAEIYNRMISNGKRVSKDLVNKVVGAINSQINFQHLPMMTISSYVFDTRKKRNSVPSGGQKYPINQDYIRSILDRNNIIGINKKAFSGSNDYIVYVFNLSKVQDAEKVPEQSFASQI